MLQLFLLPRKSDATMKSSSEGVERSDALPNIDFTVYNDCWREEMQSWSSAYPGGNVHGQTEKEKPLSTKKRGLYYVVQCTISEAASSA